MSNRFGVAFSTGRDSETFRDNRTEIPSLSQDKGTTGQAKNLAKGRVGLGQPKSGTGRAGTAKNRDGMRDKTGQSRKGRTKTEKGCSKTEKDALKQDIWSFLKRFCNSFCPGHPGLSRDVPWKH